MLKSITLIEWLIIVVILGILSAILLGRGTRTVRADRCLSRGYLPVVTGSGGYTGYCTKLQDGNTIVVHADSLR